MVPLKFKAEKIKRCLVPVFVEEERGEKGGVKEFQIC